MDVGNRVKVMLDDFAYIPERAHRTDAGLDLKSPISAVVKTGNSVSIDTGVHIAIPEGYAGMIKSRSSLNVRYGLQSEGVIDCGYTGSILVKLYNFGKKDILIEKGDKIAQLVIQRVITPEIDIVDELDETERGDGGFGSTGK